MKDTNFEQSDLNETCTSFKNDINLIQGLPIKEVKENNEFTKPDNNRNTNLDHEGSERKTSSSHKHHKIKFFDVIVERIGYGYYQIILIIVAGFCFMTQGLYFFLNSGMFIPIQKFYEVKNSSMGISASMVYISGIVIALMMGFLTHHIGRIRLIKITLIVNVIFHIFLSLTESFVVFCLCLVVIGACVNLNGPILTNVLAESLPVKYRAFTMGSIWGWYSLGNIFLLIVYLYAMPEYSPEKYINVMNIFLFLPFITMVLGFLLLKNSPRWMIINGEEKEGIELLSEMYKQTKEFKEEHRPESVNQVFSDVEKQQIINELREMCKSKNPHNKEKHDIILEIEKSNDSGFFDIFSAKFRTISFLLTLIWILNSLVGYGPFFILPLTLSEMRINEAKQSEVDIIKSQMFVSIIGLFSNPLGGYLCELPYFGRLKTGLIAALLGFTLCFILVFDFGHVVAYLGLLNIFNTLVFNTTITYTSEIYPTYIRDYSSGVMNSLGNFGAMISQPMFILYNFVGLRIPYIFTAVFSLMTATCYFFLPKETRGAELDFEEEESDEKQVQKKKSRRESKRSNSEEEKMTIKQSLPVRQQILQSELASIISEEDKIKKDNLKLEEDKKKEEERQEEIKKIKELEAKKIEKGKKKETVKQGSTVKKQNIDANLLQIIQDEIVKNGKNMLILAEKRDKYEKKLKLLKDLVNQYENIDESKLKFDLVDLSTGVRIEIDTKDNIIAKEFITDKQCYELVIQKTNDKGEVVYDPLRYDGYIVRTIQEDINYEEMEKSGKGIKKPKKK